jgi:hypothetical protein
MNLPFIQHLNALLVVTADGRTGQSARPSPGLDRGSDPGPGRRPGRAAGASESRPGQAASLPRSLEVPPARQAASQAVYPEVTEWSGKGMRRQPEQY